MGRLECALKFTKGMLERPKFVKQQIWIYIIIYVFTLLYE